MQLRHTLSLLSELQPVWLDAPPRVAEAIRNVLAKAEKINFGKNAGESGGGGSPWLASASSFVV